MEARVSVVVATRNRAEMLSRLLVALTEQSVSPDEFEVIVVDDGSTDRTPEVLRSAGENGLRMRDVRVERGGPARARNAGWRLATAPLVAFTDDDCIPTPGWLSAKLEAAERSPAAAIQGRTEVDPRDAEHAGPYSRTLEVTEKGPFYPTCNMTYPRGMLERLGGFDEAYPLPGGEDTDLAWRALESAARIEYEPRAIVYHGVVQHGPVGKLRWALHWSDAMQVYRRHPGLRRTLTWRVFWKHTHALFALAMLGAAFSRRFPPALALTLPYVRLLRARCIVEGYSLALMPYLALYDAVEVLATARGAVRHRVLVL